MWIWVHVYFSHIVVFHASIELHYGVAWKWSFPIECYRVVCYLIGEDNEFIWKNGKDIQFMLQSVNVCAKVPSQTLVGYFMKDGRPWLC